MGSSSNKGLFALVAQKGLTTKTLKGKRIGQSQISERHANFIVNLGGAKAADVLQLTELAQAEVRSRFGVELVLEVKLLGEWAAQ